MRRHDERRIYVLYEEFKAIRKSYESEVWQVNCRAKAKTARGLQTTRQELANLENTINDENVVNGQSRRNDLLSVKYVLICN
jgi:hypothetical protein